MSSSLYDDRADDYELGRPSYPVEVVACLTQLGARRGTIVADVGAGTGIFSHVLLGAGYPVIAVEPDEAMRERICRDKSAAPDLTVLDGTAERTGIGTDQVGAVTVAQALHWFDLGAASREFHRITTARSPFLAFWNERRPLSAFGYDFEQVVERMRAVGGGAIQQRVASTDPVELVTRILGGPPTLVERFNHRQEVDRERLWARLFSMSFAPGRDDPFRAAVDAELERVYHTHQDNGIISIDYETVVVGGALETPTL